MSAHLVELDLLRAGRRLPALGPLPRSDFYAFVCRRDRRPNAEVYAWTLRHRLSEIPVPLAGPDSDAILELQATFEKVYDLAGYDDSLDRRGAPTPPFGESDAAWARAVLRGRR
ncbi:MAG: DUF4058 family protein [Planctomycetes bacterium]|nr:DUF4058 family protein [Planctomycetota bacterium]